MHVSRFAVSTELNRVTNQQNDVDKTGRAISTALRRQNALRKHHGVRLLTCNGHDWTDRYAMTALPQCRRSRALSPLSLAACS
jgi:hypothetical protein